MTLKTKFISTIAFMCLVIGLILVGIWAAETQTINLKGTVDFTISDPSLYVTDIRIKNSMSDQNDKGTTINNFVPGYVNKTMNLNFGQIDNTTGGLSIYIDIINTTTTTYVASSDSSISGAEIQVSGTINGDGISQSNILTTDSPSGTVEIIIEAPSINILDLSQISILLNENTDNKVIAYNSMDMNIAIIDENGITHDLGYLQEKVIDVMTVEIYPQKIVNGFSCFMYVDGVQVAKYTAPDIVVLPGQDAGGGWVISSGEYEQYLSIGSDNEHLIFDIPHGCELYFGHSYQEY